MESGGGLHTLQLAPSTSSPHTHHSPHQLVETERAEAVAALGLQGPPQDFLTRVAQMLVLQVVGQNFLWEARLVAFQGRWWRRLLCSHYSP